MLGGTDSGAVSGAGEGRPAGSPRRGCKAAPEPESDSIKAATGCGPSCPRQAARQPLGRAGREAPGRLRSEFKALCLFTCFLQFRSTSEELTCHCGSHGPISAGTQRWAREGRRAARWSDGTGLCSKQGPLERPLHAAAPGHPAAGGGGTRGSPGVAGGAGHAGPSCPRSPAPPSLSVTVWEITLAAATTA